MKITFKNVNGKGFGDFLKPFLNFRERIIIEFTPIHIRVAMSNETKTSFRQHTFKYEDFCDEHTPITNTWLCKFNDLKTLIKLLNQPYSYNLSFKIENSEVFQWNISGNGRYKKIYCASFRDEDIKFLNLKPELVDNIMKFEGEKEFILSEDIVKEAVIDSKLYNDDKFAITVDDKGVKLSISDKSEFIISEDEMTNHYQNDFYSDILTYLTKQDYKCLMNDRMIALSGEDGELCINAKITF